MRRKQSQAVQGTFGFTRHGGRRPGAGRKPKGQRAGVSHRTRSTLASRFPVHVTTRLFAGLPNREAAAILNLPERTAERTWTYARAWLLKELQKMTAE